MEKEPLDIETVIETRAEALHNAVLFAELANPNATPQDVMAVADVFYKWLAQT